LLKSGETQAHFCFTCHTDGVGAPYDAYNGLVIGGTENYSSTAGGFVKTGGAAGVLITSRHKVWGFSDNDTTELDQTSADAGFTAIIPGSTDKTITGKGLVCGSCHDPHAGGPLVLDENGLMEDQETAGAAFVNPRLLRTTLFSTGDLYVRLKVSDVGNFGIEPNSPDIYAVVGYVDGSNAWCAGCHDKFNKDAGSGSDKTGDTMYRHAMGVSADLETDLDGRSYADLKIPGTPLEGETSTTTGVGSVACLTCHRAHSSTADAGSWAWNRDGGGTAQTSALLRMDGRGVCWSCHGAAEANKPD
jgi:hypothetical protein